MVKLRDVVDIRTGLFYSIAVVKPKNVRFFVPVDEYEGGEL